LAYFILLFYFVNNFGRMT